MKIHRILHLALTSFLGQGISVVTQLLLPPFFFRYYIKGAEVYGEWIALSAAVTYLGTLNYGIQTYATNQMAILYNGGELKKAKEIQASALRLLLFLIITFVIAGLVVFNIPLAGWLKLKTVSAKDASMALYLLMVQLSLGMLFNLLIGSFMVIGKLHRGNYWGGASRLCGVLALGVAVYFRSSFPTLAVVQLVAAIPFLLMVMVDLHKTAPILLPSLRYGTWRQTLSMIKPSGHFGLIAIGGFLTWQAPVLLIQRTLGAEAVTLFALSRVVFQMSRQILSVATYMVSQDITLLVGQRSWQSLRRLYDLSERLVLFLIPIVSVGTLLLCPLLFTIWLKKREFYQPSLCLSMAIISAVLGIKEHKTQFQASSNQHEELSLLIVCGYTAMLSASAVAMKPLGLIGFMVIWITWEIVQTAFVLRMNARLLKASTAETFKPIIRLCFFMIISFALASWPAYKSIRWPLWIIASNAIATAAILGLAAYGIFGMDEVRVLVQTRISRRLNPKWEAA